MRKHVCIVVVAWLVSLLLAAGTPLQVWAAELGATVGRAHLQAAGLDPALQAVVLAGVAATAPYTAGAAGGAAVVTPEPTEESTEEPTAEPTEEPTEEPTPEPTGEPTEEPTPSPDQAEYSAEGVTLLAPSDWKVTEGGFGTLFEIAVPDTQFVGMVQSGDDSFPGLVGVVLFATQGDAFLAQYMEGAELISTETKVTGQNIPMAKVSFNATFEGMEGTGAFYLFSPGASTYLLIAFAPTDEWDALAPAVDQMAESLTFDADMITLMTAEGDETEFSDSAGQLTVVLPEGWSAADTNDPSMTMVVADPEFRFVGGMGSDVSFGGDTSGELDKFLNPPGGELDAQAYDDLIQVLLDMLGASSDEIQFDRDQAATFPRDNAVTVRLVGTGDLGDNLKLPIVFYFDLRTDGSVAMIVFGDIDAALAREDEILSILESTELQ